MLVPMLAFALYHAWIYLAFNPGGVYWDLSSQATGLPIHQASIVASAVTFVAIALAPAAVQEKLATRRSLEVSAVVFAFATAGIVFAPGPVQLMGAVLTGPASSVIVLYLIAIFSSYSGRMIIMLTALGYFVANAIYFGSLMLPPIVSSCIAVASALVCALLLIPFPITPSIHRETTQTDDEPHSRGLIASAKSLVQGNTPWATAAAILVVMFVYGGVRVFMGMLGDAYAQDVWTALAVVFAVVILFFSWGALFRGGRVSLGSIYRLIPPLLAGALLCVVLFGQDAPAASLLVTKAVNVGMGIIIWIVVVDLVRLGRARAFSTICVVYAAYQVGILCGQMAGWALVGNENVFVVISVMALIIISSFVSRDQELVFVFDAPTQDELRTIEERGKQSTIEDKVAVIAINCSLTPREAEILTLWAKGYGTKYIQNEMTISAETVKTHVRHIYEKCSVHSRDEVISLLESA